MQLGHFTIVRLLGTGGMGEVYEAQDAKLGRDQGPVRSPSPSALTRHEDPTREGLIEGGTSPVWAWGGRELFYRNGDAMMSVGVTTQPRFSAETPRLLFRGPYEEPARPDWPRNYAVSLDGPRFRAERT